MPLLSRAVEFVDAAIAAGMFCFDIEHDPELTFSVPKFELWGCGFAVPVGMQDKSGNNNHVNGMWCFYSTDQYEISHIINTLFGIKSVEAIAYNGKYDIKCLKAAEHTDIYPENLCDPMVALNLLDDNLPPNQLGLKFTVNRLYPEANLPDFKTVAAAGKDSKEFEEYAINDVRWTLTLWIRFKKAIIDQGLLNLFKKILMPVSKAFADMEQTGIFWDKKEADRLYHAYVDLGVELKKDLDSELGEININSPKQLSNRLFNELGLPTKDIEKREKTGNWATDSKNLLKLAPKFPICKKILSYRTALKMVKTYMKPITEKAYADPMGRIHPNFWLVSTTGRTRSDNPNFQNIPAHMHYPAKPGELPNPFEGLKIRQCVVAEPGNKLIVADLSQVELRLAGHISRDQMFLDAYLNWECKSCSTSGSSETILHECPNCAIKEDPDVIDPKKMAIGFWHGLDLHSMTTNSIPALGGNRQAGKMCNFALIYCATAWRMHHEYPEYSPDQWEEIIKEYMERYKGIHLWHRDMEHLLYNTGETEDIFGRKRRITRQAIAMNAKHALNQFVNFPVQSSACALIQLSMVNMRNKWIETGDWNENIFLTNFVHDEVIFECKEAFVDDALPTIRYFMENAVQLRVPMRVDYGVFDSWGDAK